MTDHQQQANAGDAMGGATFVAVLGMVAGILVIWKLAAAGVLQVLPALSTDLLDRSGIAAVLAFLLLLKCRPDDRSGWMRFLCGVLGLNAGLFLISAVAAQLAAVISAAGPYDYAVGYVKWGQLVVMFLAFFPLSSGLARIGLLPGFHWGHDLEAAESADRDKTAATPPGWWPPRTVHFLPGIVLLFGFMTFGPDVFRHLAAAWPNSILTVMDPFDTVRLVTVGGALGFAALHRCRWPTLLVGLLLGATVMALATVAFALSLPLWAWLGLGPAASRAIAEFAPLLVAVAAALYLVYRLLDRESRREDAEVSSDPNAAPREEPRA